MLRSFFIYLSKADWARRLIMGWSFSRNMASRFIAGVKLEDAVRVVRELNARGINATLDHLGESTEQKSDAVRAVSDILDILEVIERENISSGVSVKLSQIGLGLDENFCSQNLRKIIAYAQEKNTFVRIDMEDSTTVEATLRIYHRMRTEFSSGTLGLVIQSYLYRSVDDVSELLKSHTRIRLCKGAYKESADVAFPLKKDVDNNYDRITANLLKASLRDETSRVSEDGRFPPIAALATHDEKRIKYALKIAEEINLPKDGYEFQMLHGIRRDLQESLVANGYKVRIYVPYGTQWYPYFMRRLAERPANVWFLLSNLFRH
jgi:proline dehydrogenase